MSKNKKLWRSYNHCIEIHLETKILPFMEISTILWKEGWFSSALFIAVYYCKVSLNPSCMKCKNKMKKIKKKKVKEKAILTNYLKMSDCIWTFNSMLKVRSTPVKELWTWWTCSGFFLVFSQYYLTFKFVTFHLIIFQN